MNKNMYDFDLEQAYQLVKITNSNGTTKEERPDFYKLYLGCKAVGIQFDSQPDFENKHRLWMHFIQDENGNWIRRDLHTSIVYQINETVDGIEVHTHNSIYYLQKTVLEEPEYREEAELIELYLSLDDNCNFCKGFYYDCNKEKHELFPYIHVGLVVDTALVGIKERIEECDFLCRYYIWPDKIEFYNTIYQQQDYSVPILVHNNGSQNLIVCFEFMNVTWTIKPGESKRIVPYRLDGAD